MVHGRRLATTGAWPTRRPATASPGSAAASSSTSARRQLQRGRVRPGRGAHARPASTCCSPATRSSPAATSRASSSTPTAPTASPGPPATSPSARPAATRRSTATTSPSRRSSATRRTPRTRTRCGTWATTPTPTATTTTASASRYQKNAGTVSQWVKVPGRPATRTTSRCSRSGTQGTAFDTMKVADLRPVAKPAAAGTGLYGFYTGTNAADFAQPHRRQAVERRRPHVDRRGDARDADRQGPAGAFDAGGVACPAPVVKGDAAGWWVYHTSFDARAGTPSAIGLHTVSERPRRRATRTATAPVLAARRHLRRRRPGRPVRGRRRLRARALLRRQGRRGRRGRSAWPPPRPPPRRPSPRRIRSSRRRRAPTTPAACATRSRTRRRTAAGGSSTPPSAPDGVQPHRLRHGSGGPLDLDQAGPRHGRVHRRLRLHRGRRRAELRRRRSEPAARACSSPAPTASAGPASARPRRPAPATSPSGAADLRARRRRRARLAADRVDAGDRAGRHDARGLGELLPDALRRLVQPYQVASDTDLPFLLTVQKMRWQVRMTSESAAATPTLEQLTVNHAPVQFPTSATAVTVPIGPPDGLYLLSWGDLILSTRRARRHRPHRERARRRRRAGRRAAAGDRRGRHDPADRRGRRRAASSSPSLGFTGDGATSAKVKSLTATYTTTTTPSQLTLTAGKTLLPTAARRR